MNPLISSLIPFATASVLAFSTVSANAADLPKELTTAITHAGLASGSSDLKTVQVHLHHVVNCLVGPNGAGFDAGQANPCKDQGDGAIPDAPAEKQKILLTAVTTAQGGLAETDLDKAKADAANVQAIIRKAE
jgi:hypothetical protein